MRVLQSQWCEPDVERHLANWYQSPLGQRLLRDEKQELEQELSNLFGYHLIWLNTPWTVEPMESCRIRHQVVIGSPVQPGRADMYSLPDVLPIQTDSIDVMVLPHVLEFSKNPHQILREVDRCLIPEGHVVIVGFSPWSFWGLRHWLTGWSRRVPWCGRFLSSGKLAEWFSLLGFDSVRLVPVYVNPPVNHAGILRRMEWFNRLAVRGWPIPPASYIYVAKKRVMGMTPIRPRWRPRRAILSPGMVEPSQRSSQNRQL